MAGENDVLEARNNIMSPEEERQMEQAIRERDRDLMNRRRGLGSLSLIPGTSGISLPNSTEDCNGKIGSHSARLEIGFADTIGRRATMEDAITILGSLRNNEGEDFVAIYDGHGGGAVSSFVSKHLHKFLAESMDITEDPLFSLKEAFNKTNDMIKKNCIPGGTTAIVAFFYKKRCYIGNLGDSRAVLCQNERAIRCSTDHKPDNPDEELRIQQSGGWVTKQVRQGKTISRVNGMLAVSRALGDVFLQPSVSPIPEVLEINISHPSSQLLILACDGLWDVIDDEEAISIAASAKDPQAAAEALRDRALHKGSTDNISVVVIKLPPNETKVVSHPTLPRASKPNFFQFFRSSFLLLCLAFVALGALTLMKR